MLFSGIRQLSYPGNKFTGGEPGAVRCRSSSATLISVWIRNFPSLTLLVMTAKDSALPPLPDTWLDSFHTQHPAVQMARGIPSFTSLGNVATWDNFEVVSWVGLSNTLVARPKSDVPVSRYNVPLREWPLQEFWTYHRIFVSNNCQGPLLDATYCGAAFV